MEKGRKRDNLIKETLHKRWVDSGEWNVDPGGQSKEGWLSVLESLNYLDTIEPNGLASTSKVEVSSRE